MTFGRQLPKMIPVLDLVVTSCNVCKLGFSSSRPQGWSGFINSFHVRFMCNLDLDCPEP